MTSRWRVGTTVWLWFLISWSSWAGGPDYGVRLTLEGAPSKLRLGGFFPEVTDELWRNRGLLRTSVPKHFLRADSEDCAPDRDCETSHRGIAEAQLLFSSSGDS